MKKFYFLLLALAFFTRVEAQIVNIPDANFKAKLLAANSTNQIASTGNVTFYNSSYNCSVPFYSKIDVNNNGEIEISEAQQVKWLQLSNVNIGSLVGIEQFTNLQYLDCSWNYLTNLNVSALTGLIYLNCYKNNTISSLDVSGLLNLKKLNCSTNQIVYLDVSRLTNLYSLDCSYNQLTSLDLSRLTILEYFECSHNQISSLDSSALLNVVMFHCDSNRIRSLSVENLRKLKRLTCRYNLMNNLNIKCGNLNWEMLYIDNNSFRYICADEEDISLVRQQAGYGFEVNTYCSFSPGGVHYTINGNNKFDSNNNGCDVSDISLPNLKFSITNGIIAGTLISNSTGNYSIPVQAGTHTVTPVFENPSYFNISPASVTVTFPTLVSPFTQNFCVTPNGVHSDLEVTVILVGAARPGFDAKYKIVYKNKGNQVESGSVNLTFDDAKMDCVSSNPVFNSQIFNQLTWNYSALQPFETRTIDVVFNINSPTESPAVNGGDVLSYTAAITFANTDETPNDNTFVCSQTVVNSFDPNDKTCLEGATISPTEVGKYVHYLIRFENTGTFPAQNIVVKDMIDTAKFDINSLVPIKGSHDYFTRIDGNKAEFIFENINLPYDDANNDGYVVFKIKTKPTLVAGNTFSNSASIYFDYNFPIVTNTATTTITTLSNPSFEFANYFSLYPNPTTNELNINLKSAIEINSIQIYNTIGQLVTVQTGNALKVDVSNLAAGNYFIKINSDKGTSNSKFIKQ